MNRKGRADIIFIRVTASVQAGGTERARPNPDVSIYYSDTNFPKPDSEILPRRDRDRRRRDVAPWEQ